MADEKEVNSGCGGCGCGRSEQNGEGSNNESERNADIPTCSFGEAIVAGAILEMENGESKEKKCSDSLITEADIDGFIERCEKEGKNPLDVVKFVAEINGIDISSECVPKDALKRGVYGLLKGVVKKVLIGFVSYYTDKYGLNFLQSLISSCGSYLDSEKSSRSSEKVSDTSTEVRPVYVRLIPVSVGYAFSW